MTALSIAVHARPGHDDDRGYSAFYQRYERPLVCYLRMGFRDADVEAVAQEAFCRALTRWSEVSRMSNPWPWLAVTARNLARNNIRDETSSQPTGLDVFDIAECSTVDVAEQVEASDQLRRLAKAMDVLTPLQRQLLTVLVEEGLTGAQVARRLGMQPGAARMHLCRMRARLSERFVALGGQLGVIPFAVIKLVVRRPRHRAVGPQHAPLAAGSAAFALSVAAVAIGAVAIGTALTAPTFADAVAVAPRGMAVRTSDAGKVADAFVSEAGGAASGRNASAQSALAGPAVGYRMTLTKTPTRPGKTADADIELSTPVGTLRVSVPVIMQSPDPGTPCPLGVGC